MHNTDLDSWARRLGSHLTEHIQAERAALDAYVELQQHTAGTLIGYLTEMIVRDERNHHQLLSDMRDALQSGFIDSDRNALARRLDDDRATEALRRATEALLEVEHDDLDELEDLRRELASVADTEPWTALVEVMRLDTTKHIRILSFMLDQL